MLQWWSCANCLQGELVDLRVLVQGLHLSVLELALPLTVLSQDTSKNIALRSVHLHGPPPQRQRVTVLHLQRAHPGYHSPCSGWITTSLHVYHTWAALTFLNATST